MKKILILALLISPAFAGEVSDTLTDADKAVFLKCAYRLNNNSMVGNAAVGSIDLSWPGALEQCDGFKGPEAVEIEPPPPWPPLEKADKAKKRR